MRHLKGKIGHKSCMNDKHPLRTFRISRKALRTVIEELKNHNNFQFPKKMPKQNKEKLQEHSLHFLNFIDSFGNGSSNNNNHWKFEKGIGSHENHRNRFLCVIIDNMKDYYFKWTSVERRKLIVRQIGLKCIRRNCLLFFMELYFVFISKQEEVIVLIALVRKWDTS